MILPITKSARRFEYVIWSSKTDAMMKQLLENRADMPVSFNDLSIGSKSVDWKYPRISIGYEFTRALPETANVYKLRFHNGILEVKAF